MPKIVDTAAGLTKVCGAIAGGTGPVAIDAERASGYRYSARAYLIQLRREGAGTFLVDPIAFDSLAPLQEALEGTEWILHAATQDLPCMTELGLYPTRLFDTELAGRLLGYPRVGLASLVESLLGRTDGQGALRRRLVDPAAARAVARVRRPRRRGARRAARGAGRRARRGRQGRLGSRGVRVAQAGSPSRPAMDQWRRTSGLHKVRGRRALGAVRALWTTRDQIAAERDVTPSRIIPDSAIVAAALAMPTTRAALKATKGFYGRGADRYAGRWVAVLAQVRDLPESPAAHPYAARGRPASATGLGRQGPGRGPAAPAGSRGDHRDVRGAQVPAENLLTPDFVRRVLWTPPETREPEPLTRAISVALRDLGARAWQVRLAAPLLADGRAGGRRGGP